MKYAINITGSGTDEEIAQSLEGIAKEIREGSHVDLIARDGECEWEGVTLAVNIEEEDAEK